MLTKLIEVFTTLGKGVDINEMNDSGDAPIHIALTLNHHAIVHTLIHSSTNLALLNGSGNSPLHVLAQCIADNRDNSSLYMKVRRLYALDL